MDPCTNEEHVWLQLRVNELEGRLAELEEETRRLRGEESLQRLEQEADADREGARLVVIEMLTAGYTPAQIGAYLRQTFGIEDADVLLAEAGSLAG